MAIRIDTVSARAKLVARREPYWQRISQGLFLGFRKMASSGEGTWVIRYRADDQTQSRHSLGSLDQYPGMERFDKAADSAKAWLVHLKFGGTTEHCTVKDICDSYVRRIQELKGETAAAEISARYRRWIHEDPISQVEVAKLTREQVKAWRGRMVSAPVKVGKTGATRARSKDTVNRDVAVVRAALNLAMADGKATSDLPWRQPLAAFKNASRRREVYLDREQRKRFIQHAPDDLAPFIRCLSMLPLRPGALAALTVASLDVHVGVLKIGKDKHGNDRKIKLPPQIATLLMANAGGRPPTAPLFARKDGVAWNKNSWSKPLKSAAIDAGLPVETIAYTLRHSAITDLVHGGLDLLTVAQISGTSVAMIERHYGHLRNDVASLALSKLVL